LSRVQGSHPIDQGCRALPDAVGDLGVSAWIKQVGCTHVDGTKMLPFPMGRYFMAWPRRPCARGIESDSAGAADGGRPAVNLVSRLEGLCRQLDKAVLVSGTLAAETEVPLVPLGTHALRGIASPCTVFTVPEN
jgi:hypothetical protein